MRDSADTVVTNRGRTGGPAARAASLRLGAHRDLERAGDRLHERHRALIDRHGLTGRAQIVDHTFRWHTELAMSWSDAWVKNQLRQANERNVVVMIPGRERGEVVIMADHYDTAYMEDVYEKERGGDGLRAAAAGADDNASATSALLAAADILLPLAHTGQLRRDVWLVHLTGEEFPADCLGARALARALVERNLRLAAEDGSLIDVSRVRAAGIFVLDMIGHNNGRDRDVFQIACGEGAASARLARAAHMANRRWNEVAAQRNRRPGAGRRPVPNAGKTGGCHRPSPTCLCAARSAPSGSPARPSTTPTDNFFRRGRAGGPVHGELRHQPLRLPRHARHHGKHRSGLHCRPHRHRHRGRGHGSEYGGEGRQDQPIFAAHRHAIRQGMPEPATEHPHGEAGTVCQRRPGQGAPRRNRKAK